LQLLLSAQQLMAAIAAETGTFSEAAAPAAPAVQQPVGADMQSMQQQQQQWAIQLPLPWPAGSSEVQLIGVVAQRRRCAGAVGSSCAVIGPSTVADLQAAHFACSTTEQKRSATAVCTTRSVQLSAALPHSTVCSKAIGSSVCLCRIAKLLLFCSLVPESVPPLPADGTAAYVRRLWRHPDAPGLPCEVRHSGNS
jgi:hypothetical protein